MRGAVAIIASLATLGLAVQVIVIEPTSATMARAAGAAAARDAALAARLVRAGDGPGPGARIVSAAARPSQPGGVAAVGNGRLVWVPAADVTGSVDALRVRVLLLIVSGAIGVVGWGLWAGVVRRRDAQRTARRQVEMVGMVAHDLRSPLTGIALAADRLEQAELPAARVAARAAIERESLRLQAIADDILSVCCERVSPDNQRAEESLSDVLEDVAARVRSAHACSVIVDADLDARRLRADRGLARAIANVAENAARHSPPGQAVRLRAAAAADSVELVVEDAGEGFASSFQLAPFQRGQRGGRAGLGLASSRRVMERLGGSLRVGDRFGGGASVSLRLPRRGLSQ